MARAMAQPKASKSWIALIVLQLAVAAFVVHRLVSFGVLDVKPVLQLVGLHRVPPCGFLPTTEFVITSDRVVLPGGIAPALVHVREERIAGVYSKPAVDGAVPEALQQLLSRVLVIDYGNSVVSPGLVDVHTHMNDPGREDWEGMSTATMAAAAGGVTTVVDMPLNSFPTTCNASLLKDKIAIAKRKSHIDAAFWGGLVPDNANNHAVLHGMLNAGALGFKAFMHPSGIGDFPNVNISHVEAALPVAKARGVPILLHAEDAAYGVVPQDTGYVVGPARRYSSKCNVVNRWQRWAK